METIEGDNEGTNTGRLTEKSAFGKCVFFQQAVLECTDFLLFILIIAIQRAQVKIG